MEVGRGCRKEFRVQPLAQEAQKCYRPGPALATTVMKFSVAEEGAKGKACTLKLKARVLKLFKLTLCLPLSRELSRTVKIFESGVLERWEGAKRGLLLVIPAGPPALPVLGGRVISVQAENSFTERTFLTHLCILAPSTEPGIQQVLSKGQTDWPNAGCQEGDGWWLCKIKSKPSYLLQHCPGRCSAQV